MNEQFNQMMNFMMNIVMVKLVFNELPHALGLFDTSGEKIAPLTVSRPGLVDLITINEGLRQSMREEEMAISKYHTRAAHAKLNDDDPTAEVYAHIAAEEQSHYVEFGNRLRERLQGQTQVTYAIEGP